MTSFMGPMAPPPPAQPQPQALDIRTNPNQRQQFKQFMKQRTSMMPMTSAPIAQPPMMPMMQPPMPMPMARGAGGGIVAFNEGTLVDANAEDEEVAAIANAVSEKREEDEEDSGILTTGSEGIVGALQNIVGARKAQQEKERQEILDRVAADKGFTSGERGEFGRSFSIICAGHQTRKSRVQLDNIRAGYKYGLYNE